MRRRPLTDEVIPLLADRFRVLAEPARLCLLRRLMSRGELTVTELVEGTGLQQANVSKHLQVLHAHGFLARRKEGLFVHYRLANKDIVTLCEIMGGLVEPA
jgi:DNA-binding transcriptional ArsR family regulator